jgi:PIN domain nuclease of toxin-antitoxin system
VRILLDTQVWLWMQAESQRLSGKTRELVLDPENELLLSAASAWEIAIKYTLGKLPLPNPPDEYVPSRMQESGTRRLPIQHTHVLWTANLPLHHRDPFDRLLVSQAQLEDLPLLTVDRQLAAYDLELLWA